MQEDDPLGLGWEIGKAQQSTCLGIKTLRRSKAVLRQQRREGRDAEGNSCRAAPEEMAPGHAEHQVASRFRFLVHHSYSLFGGGACRRLSQ